MFRRHPILVLLGTFVLVVAAALAYFVFTFDLNSYRTALQGELSQRIGQPVTVGDAHLSLRHGLSLKFSALRIGPEEEPLPLLKVESFYLKLDWLPLLTGQVVIREALLVSPFLRLPWPGKPAAADAGRSSEPPAALQIRGLRIEDGALQIDVNEDSENSHPLRFTRLNGRFTDLLNEEPCRFKISGTYAQPEAEAKFNLLGKAGPHPWEWRNTPLEIQLETENLSLPSLLERLSLPQRQWEMTGAISLKLSGRGVPAKGLRIVGNVIPHNGFFLAPAFFRSGRPLPELQFQTSWRLEAGGHRFEALDLKTPPLDLQGEVTLNTSGETPWLETSLTASRIDWERLRDYFPDRNEGSSGSGLIRKILQLQVKKAEIRLAGGLDDFWKKGEDFPLREGLLELEEGVVDLGRAGRLTGVGGVAFWSNGRLDLERCRFSLAGKEIAFAGSILDLGRPGESIDLNLNGALPLDAFKPFLKDRPTVVLTGSLLLNGHLAGNTSHILTDLRADLRGTGAQVGGHEFKKAGTAGDLLLTGAVADGTLQIGHGKLTLPFLELRGRGRWQWSADQPFFAALDLSPVELSAFRDALPVLQKIEAKGELGAHLEFEGAAGSLRRRHGKIFLRGVGCALTPVLAPFSEGTGELELEGDSFSFDHVTAKIGRSSLQGSGTLRLTPSWQLSLLAKSKAIHADDLIFRSPAAILQDTEGHLVFDQKGIVFDDIRTRLKEGTTARVSGRLSNFSAPRVHLDITAGYANIDEVIALWRGEGRPKQSAKPPRPEAWLTIDVAAAEGSLWNLQFHRAAGRITYAGSVLNIRPLSFEAGGGSCQGQVVVEGGREEGPRLKISGRLTQVDAYALHNELLKRRGLVSGALNGNFYLEGDAGKDFLPTSMGGFELRVKDGVLRKWPFLSKVFSLLNVSQIFSLKLPDMAKEGMPFNTLNATLALDKGILSSEDLFVEGNAMNFSLVGQSNLNNGTLDLTLGVKPLRTVDKIITKIPIAGWLLTGEEKALITAHFRVTGAADDPTVLPVPITSVSEKVLGIFKRVLGLPGKVISDVGELVGEEGK